MVVPQSLLLAARPRRDETTLDISAADFPALNVWSDEDGLHVQALVPGLAPEALEVTVDGRALTIAGEINGLPGATTRERRRGAFKRIVRAPFAIDAERVTSELNNGVLQLRLQPAATEQPRKIRVANGDAGN